MVYNSLTVPMKTGYPENSVIETEEQHMKVASQKNASVAVGDSALDEGIQEAKSLYVSWAVYWISLFH